MRHCLMRFGFTEAQQMLRATLERYFEHHYDLQAHAAAMNSALGWRQECWSAFANELGILGAGIPEDLGGLGGGAVETMIIMQVFGSHLVLEPYWSTAVIGGGLLRRSGAVEAAAMLEKLVAGRLTIALAATEPGRRFDVAAPATRAVYGDDGWRLQGRKTVIYGLPGATHLVVTAMVDGEAGVALFLADAAAPELVVKDYRLIDGRRAADIDLNAVPALFRLCGAAAGDSMFNDVLDEARVALAAEATGCMLAALQETIAYAKTRRQFGVAISSFQVIRHRLVDMHVWLETAISMVHMAAQKIDGGAADRPQSVAAMMMHVLKAARFVGQTAVQIHGGMGLSNETKIGQIFKRLTVIERQIGTADDHLTRYDGIAGAPVDDEAGDADFRAEVQRFIAAHLTGDMAAQAQLQTGTFAAPDLSQRWQRLLHARGWAAPAWPVEYGGPDWSAEQRHIFHEECARANAPVLPAMGLQMCGPVLMKYGTAEQKSYFLPRILSAEDYWCQGYSEPGAGSDLAALALRAKRDGDDYVLNGTKLWTTHAQFANWIFLLVRTSAEGKPNAGITFLLAPMNLPGITIKPIISLGGEHEVNQLFFDDVRVPVANRVGAENAGWTVAKYLLEFERGGGHQIPFLQAGVRRLRTLVRAQLDDDGADLWENTSWRRRVCEIEIAAVALHWTEQRMVYSLPVGQNIGDATASLMKLAWSETSQKVTELALDAIGPYGAVQQTGEMPVGGDTAATPLACYLTERVNTIAGGSSEIQRNIIARSLGV